MRWSGPPPRRRDTAHQEPTGSRRFAPGGLGALSSGSGTAPAHLPVGPDVSRPAPRPALDGDAAGAALIREWVRFRAPAASFEDPFLDAARPLILLDTFGWPAAYPQRHGGSDYVAPNLDTSVFFHRLGTGSEWLLIDHTCPVAGDGLLGVSGKVWGNYSGADPAFVGGEEA